MQADTGRWPSTDPITAEGTDTVVLKFHQPNAAVINSFVVSNVNWIASPTALQQHGRGASSRSSRWAPGRSRSVSNQLSSELVLERNPDYFVPDRPYLDKLTFRSIGGDQPAYQALLAGQAQAYEGMTTIPLLEQAKTTARLVVTQQPATSPYVIQLNTKIAPFNDKRAREAIYYATNFEAIREGLFKGLYPVSQTFTGRRRAVPPRDRPGLPHVRPGAGQGARRRARRADRRARHAQDLRRRAGEHRAADPVGGGRHQDHDPLRAAQRTGPEVHRRQVAGDAADRGRLGPGRRASASGSGSARPRRSAASADPTIDELLQQAAAIDRRGGARRALLAGRAAHQRRGLRAVHPGVRAGERRHEERARPGPHHPDPAGRGEHGDPLGRGLDEQARERCSNPYRPSTAGPARGTGLGSAHQPCG